MSTDPKLRDEIAGLTEAVRELRDREVAGTIRELRAEVEKLRAERSGHHCHGCHCGHATWVYTPWVPTVSQPYMVTCGSVTTGDTFIGSTGGDADSGTLSYVTNCASTPALS